MIRLLGFIAAMYGMYGSMSILMQARKMLKQHQSCDVSLSWLDSYVGGYLIWLAYGIGIHSIPLIASDASGLLCGCITLGVTLMMRRRGTCPVKGASK